MQFQQRFKSKLWRSLCLKKEGIVKVREFDQKSKEVPLTLAILSKDRLTYFIDPKDETSIQGSLELGSVVTPINLIQNFESCFELRTMYGVHDCSVCVENEKTAREWIAAITQNIVNCN